jgi:hypothetical protein
LDKTLDSALESLNAADRLEYNSCASALLIGLTTVLIGAMLE